MSRNKLQYYVKILINGRRKWLKVKMNKSGSLPVVRNGHYSVGTDIETGKQVNFECYDVKAFYQGSLSEIEGLGMAYIPTSDSCTVLDTVVPDSMGYEIHIALRKMQERAGVPVNEYVSKRLDYTEIELCKALSAEQIDAVFMSIFNIEEKRQAVIVGDQTGIGKGRVAAAMIRYGVLQGYKPIFFSEKPNLFTDLYRDLIDIGSGDLFPFIVNGKAAKTDIKNKNGKIVYSALPKNEQLGVFKRKKLPFEFDFVCTTYSQISSLRYFVKRDFISKIAARNIIIMDESHNASGSSNTGAFLQDILQSSEGAVFLSATFAKRADNMPIYAMKTSISDANMTDEELVDAVVHGGVALQEVISSQLVSEGQMIRRERSFEGIEVNYITLNDKKQEHEAVYDNITSVLRDIIKFQADHIKPIIDQLDDIATAEGSEVESTKGTSKAGVDNQPYFSRVFNVINQLLFSIKAESVADRAIERLKEGKKPVIAFASTMESLFKNMGVNVGDSVDLSYAIVLQNGLKSVMKMTTSNAKGERTVSYIPVEQLTEEASEEYWNIQKKIRNVSKGIIISPIDLIKNKIEKAGYTVAEVTGRSTEVQIIENSKAGILIKRNKMPVNDAFREFNDNVIDCLMINQSGSTGASAHAIVTEQVSAEYVKQRVMIVLQPELNINTEVQKRGRINRTGQILKPIYDYVSSAIPAEKRLVMMLQKKLKSLDANTTSNQKQSEEIIKSDDFLNKYGDKIVTDYLYENNELSEKLDNPLKFTEGEPPNTVIGAASKVAGRVSVLTTMEQEQFYSIIVERYNNYEQYLRQTGEYDLEIEDLNFEAETKDIQTVVSGKDSGSVFSENTYMEKVEVNNLKKPFKASELKDIITKNLQGSTAEKLQSELIDEVNIFYKKRTDVSLIEIEKKYKRLKGNIKNEPKYKKTPPLMRDEYVLNRKQELDGASVLASEEVELKNKNITRNINYFLKFFKIGRVLYYPTIIGDNAKAVCVGYEVNRNQKNPFTASSIKIQIAISNSDKYIELALSGETGNRLASVIGFSQGIDDNVQDNLFQDWDYDSRKSSVNRKEVYIITGNILQGFAKYTGKLISFTTMDGSVRKGILMPDNFNPTEGGKNKVTVPIDKAADYIMNKASGTILSSDNKIAIEESYNYSYGGDVFKITVPASGKYAKFYKDQNILDFIINIEDGFERISSRMVAEVYRHRMPGLLDYLGKTHSVSISVYPSVFSEYFSDETETKSISVKTEIQKRAEKRYKSDKLNFEKRKAFKSQPLPIIDGDVKIRIRIAKARAIAKLKILKLLEL